MEEHLNCTISQVEPDIKVPVDEFDGKVTYGQKRAAGGKLWVTFNSVLNVNVSFLSVSLRKESFLFIMLSVCS